MIERQYPRVEGHICTMIVNKECKYQEVAIPGIFILHQSRKLGLVAEISGFQGSHEVDIWDWMREMDEGVRSLQESNWTRTWRQVCVVYSVTREG